MDNPRILHIVCDLRRGGTEGQCARTAMGLQGLGLSSKVAVFFREGFFFLEAVERACGKVHEIPIRKAASLQTAIALRDLARFIRHEGIALVHTWDAEAAVWGSLAARIAGVPLITSRRDLGQIYPRWKQILLRRADRQARKVVVNCQAVGDHFVARGLPREKIVVIGNILDLAEFDRLAARSGDEDPGNTGPAGSDRARFVCVSRLDPEKDHETLIRAFALLRQKPVGQVGTGLDNADLHLVGSGRLDEHLRDLVRDLGLQERVVFHGERTDVPALLRTMHAGVLTPSANEGLSNTLLEYMAAGLPVVASDCGGNRDLILGSGCGRIVPPGDAEACAEAMAELLRGPEAMALLGRRGRAYVEAQHQPATILARFHTLYRSVPAHGSPGVV